MNRQIKITLAVNSVRQWELAKILNISEVTLIRRLRNELPQEEQNRLCKLIEEYARKEGRNNE